MQYIISSIVLVLLAFPGAVFAASGPSGVVDTLGVDVYGARTAEMRASVYSYGDHAKLFFEYGPTAALGRTTASRGVLKEKSTITSMRAFSLTPGVLYYYRAVLEGASGTVYGETKTFSTSDSQNDTAYTTQNTNPTGVSGNSTTNTNTGSTVGTTNQTNTSQTGAVANAIPGNQNTQNQSGAPVFQSQNINPGGFFQRLFDSFTRARPVQLSVAMNPEKPKARDIVEYIVSYTNTSNQPVGKGELSVVIPDSVVYLADNSGGKTTLSKVPGGQKLTMATEPLSGKGKNTVTVMAVAGSGVVSTAPTAIASIGYVNTQGQSQYLSTNRADKATPLIAGVGATNGVSSQVNVSSSGSASGGGVLPNTFFEWLIFLGVVTGIIVIIRRVIVVYQERKKRILEESREMSPQEA